MTKTISNALKAHASGEVTTVCTCWRITRRDGAGFYFTDHDQNLTIDGETYVAAVGYMRSAVSSNSDFSIDNLDLMGIFDDAAITVDDLRSGLFDFAEVRIFLVNWADLSQGIMKLRRGYLGDVMGTQSGTFQTTLNGLMQMLTHNVGDLFTPSCRADLGDGQCKVDLSGFTAAGTVTSVTDTQNFTIAITEPRAIDGWFAHGVLSWTSGDNNGRAMEVKTWTQTGGVVQLYLPMPQPVQVGDALTIYPGCDKRIGHCRDKFNNIVNMRAEPYVPGTDFMLTSPPVQQ